MTILASELKGKIDFGIITIRKDEFEAVLKKFPENETIKGERDYIFSEVKINENEKYKIAIVRCHEQGEGEAQSTAHDLIMDLQPQWLVLVGIAGATPAYEYSLGDVIATTRVIDFCVRAAIKETDFQYAVAGGPIRKEVQNLLAVMTNRKLRDWNKGKAFQKTPLVKLEEANFYGDEEWKKDLKEKLEKNFGNNVQKLPKFTTGAIISADTLVKSTSLITQWKETARQVDAVEMELAGVYRAAHKTGGDIPILAIRGISDIVGFKRDAAWTEYACHSAAAFAFAVIKKLRPIEPRSKNENPQ